MCCPEDPGCSPAHPGAKVLLRGDPPVSQCAGSLTFWDLEGDLGQQPEALTLHLWPSEVLARFRGYSRAPRPLGLRSGSPKPWRTRSQRRHTFKVRTGKRGEWVYCGVRHQNHWNQFPMLLARRSGLTDSLLRPLDCPVCHLPGLVGSS